MSELLGFVMAVMLLLFAYMTVRMAWYRKLFYLPAVCLQVFSISIVLLGLKDHTQMSEEMQRVCLITGIGIPCIFIIGDMIRILCHLQWHGIKRILKAGREDAKNDVESGLNPIKPFFSVEELMASLIEVPAQDQVRFRDNVSFAAAYCRTAQYHLASDAYHEALHVIRDLPHLHYNLGNALFCKGEYAAANKAYQRCIELSKCTGHSAGKAARFPAVLKELGRLVSGKTEIRIQKTEFPLLWPCFNKGNCLYHMGKYDDAVECYKQCLMWEPSQREIHENIILALYKTGRGEEALEYFLSLDMRHHFKYQIYYITALEYIRQENLEKAVDQLRRCISRNPVFEDAYYTMGRLCSKLGWQEEACSAYSNCVRINPENFNALYHLGVMMYERGYKEQALDPLQKAAGIKPDHANCQFTLAMLYRELERYHDAFAAFRSTIRLKPDLLDAYMEAGDILVQQERHWEAVEVYTEGLQHNPKDYQLLYSLGVVFAQSGRHKEAVEAFKNAVAVNEQNIEVFYYLAASLMELRRYEEAVEVYRKALYNMPDTAEVYYQLAMVYSLLDKREIALQSLKKAIQLDECYKTAAQCNEAFRVFRMQDEFKMLVS